MAATVTSNLTLLSNCDATTGWTPLPTVDTDILVEGTGALCADVDVATSAFSYALPAGSSGNWAGRYIWIWIMVLTAPYLDVQSNGGIRIRCYNSTTGGVSAGYADWYVAGTDTYPGGWRCFVASTDYTPDLTSSWSVSYVTRIGVVFKALTKSKLSQNCFWDYLRYGPGVTVTGGTSGDQGTFANVLTGDQSSDIGAIRKEGNVYYIQGSFTFGDTGSSNSYFYDYNQTLIWEGLRSGNSFHQFNIVGGSGTNSFQLGDITGSGTSAIGSKGMYVNTTGHLWTLTAAETDIDTFKLGANLFSNASNINLGTTSTKLGGASSTIEIVDNTFRSPTIVTRNLETTATTLNQLGNKITFATDTGSSLDLYDAYTTSSSQWQIIGNATDNGPGFKSTGTGTQTITVSNHNFNFMDKPYITIDDAAETWNVINPSWTIGAAQDELAFAGTANGIVNEKYNLNITTQEPSGYKIGAARTFLLETLPSVSLPTDNRQSTNQVTSTASFTYNENSPSADTITRSTGSFSSEGFTAGMTLRVTGTSNNNGTYTIATVATLTLTLSSDDDLTAEGPVSSTLTGTTGYATSDVLRIKYTPSGATGLTLETHSGFVLKIYKYGKTPFVGALSINAAVNSGVAMLPDTYQSESNESTAVSDGTQKVVFVESSSLAQSHSIIKFTTGTGTLNVGNTVTGTGGATGVVEEIIEGDSTGGTVILKTRNSTAYVNGDSLTESGSSSDWSATYTNNSEKRFYWLIQAGTVGGTARTMQQIYDHFQAKLAEATLDTTDGWDKPILDGRAEYALPIQGVSLGSPNTFKTLRNTALTHGWCVSGLLSLSQVSSYTANDGTAFGPATLTTLTVNGVKTGSEGGGQYVRCYIECLSGGPETAGTVLLNDNATQSYGSEGYYKATADYSYVSDQPVKVRARYKGYLPFETNAVITSGGLTVTAVWQVDPNFSA